MNVPTLSRRLGISVTIFGGAVVLTLAALAYALVAWQLEKQAIEGLRAKVATVSHYFEEQSSVEDVRHSLEDFLSGHLEVQVGAMRSDTGAPVFDSGPIAREALAHHIKQPTNLQSTSMRPWSNDAPYLTQSATVRMADGSPILGVVILDRTADLQFLRRIAVVLLLAIPPLLAAVGVGAALIVRRGLQPLTRLGVVASNISARDTQRRLPLDRMPRELYELAASLNQMLERIDQGNARLNELAAQLAQELRAPISNVLEQTRVALGGPCGSEDYRRVLQSNFKDVESLARIIADALFLAQSEDPTANLTVEKFSVEDAVRRVVDYLQPLADQREITIQSSGGAMLNADRPKVERALTNLLANAIRHTPVGAVVEIMIKQEPNSAATIAIANPGKVIPEHELSRIFDRFLRGDSEKTVIAGAGLGLPIVQTIMRMHGGEVTVTNTSNGRTEFVLHFPIGPR